MRSSAWWRIGWRNLGRNRRRTLITAIGLALGYLAVVVMSGLSRGLVSEMIDNGTGMLTGQVQVFAEDYLPDRGIYDTLGGRDGVDVEGVVAAVDADPRIAAATPRVYAGGLVSTGAATAAGVIMGIDPEREIRVSHLLTHIDEGRAPTPGQYEIAIGREMARQLDAGPGDEVVVVAPGADGSLGNDLFIVSGILSTRWPGVWTTRGPRRKRLPTWHRASPVTGSRPWSARGPSSGPKWWSTPTSSAAWSGC
jgi:ABC-type lipoprotein release transport system permease subunit